MSVHWLETVTLEPGTEDDYYAAIEHRLLPYLDVAEDALRAPSGVFKVDNNYSDWPTMVALWTYRDWNAYAASRAPMHQDGRPRLHLAGPFQWNLDAAKWRRSAFTRVLVPLGLAPDLPVRPEVRSSGAVFLSQTITAKPGEARAFLAAFEELVLPGAGEVGLTLEGFWRVSARPLEFEALWSVASWSAYATLQASRDPFVESSHVLGSDETWRFVADLTERTLSPATFSPLGGIR
jgi:hypothetical protein